MEILVYISALFLCTYIFIKMIIDERGIYKVKAAAMWIILYDVNLIFIASNRTIELSSIDAWFIIMGLIIGFVFSFLFIMKSKDTLLKTFILLICFYFFFVFSISSIAVQNMLSLYIFKSMIMITLLMGLIALKDAPIFLQILGALILYIIMLGTNVLLSARFFDIQTENQFWNEIYGIVQRSYCLNPVNEQMYVEDIKMYIVDFFICKIMDVILLGFLSARFIEIVSVSKSDAKHCE